MRKINLGLLAVVMLSHAMADEQPSQPSIQLMNVRLNRAVSVEVRLFAGAKDAVVPYCGEGESGTLTLCNLAVRLERETRDGWQRVGLRHNNAVLGGVPADRWKFSRIEGGRWHDFFFSFPLGEFALQRGQHLRVVVDSWADEPSMRSGALPMRLVSAMFACP